MTVPTTEAIPTIKTESLGSLQNIQAGITFPESSPLTVLRYRSDWEGQATSKEGLLSSSETALQNVEHWIGDGYWIKALIMQEIQASLERPSTNVILPLAVSVAGIDKPDLRAALRDLDEVKDEADEEGLPPPSALAVVNAGRLIREMYDILPCRYLVELMPEGSIAVTVPGGFRRSIMLLCESNGGALCSVNMNGKHRRARYSHADQLPDGFLREALAELEQG